MDKKYPLTELFGCAYALAGRDCVNKSHVWAEHMHHYQRNDVRCVFEDGDIGKGHLIRVAQEAFKPAPLFEPGRPKPELGHPGTTPLQAADFAAWELLKALRSGKEGAPVKEFRVTLQKLNAAVPVSWTQYRQSDIEKMLSLGGIHPRARKVGV